MNRYNRAKCEVVPKMPTLCNHTDEAEELGMHALSPVGAANVAAVNSGMSQGGKARGEFQDNFYGAKVQFVMALSFWSNDGIPSSPSLRCDMRCANPGMTRRG